MTCEALGSLEHGHYNCSLQSERLNRIYEALPYCLRLEGLPLRNRGSDLPA